MKKYIETNFRQKSFEKENNWYRFCMNSLIPFITIRNKGEFSKIHWDYFSYPDESFDKLLFSLEEEIKKIFTNRLSVFQKGFKPTEKLIEKSKLLSQAELVKICDDAIKESILYDSKITENQLLKLVEERIGIYSNKEA